MKGMVFTEFIEMVEDRFSFEVSERLLEGTELPSGGVYTAVGTYDHAEMVALVSALSGMTGVPVPDLLKAFGRHLLKRFAASFPQFFEGIDTTFAFLPRVNDYVHLEVRKLYPDAQTPEFSCRVPRPGVMLMTYRSDRNLPDLAEGLILGCADHFGETIAVRREAVAGDPRATRFTLTRA